MEYLEDKMEERRLDIQSKLFPNFIALEGFRFMNLKSYKIYDLSAADISQIDRIVSEDLFLV